MKKENPQFQHPESDTNRAVYTLGIASRLSNIPAHSIRQYVDRGLLIPFKLDSKRHLFSQNDISRLKHIHLLIHEKGLNFAGIRAMMSIVPCWAICHCSESDRHSCNAYNEDYHPCWEASEKGRMCKNENCRECDVYKTISKVVDLKSVIKALI
ncbi:MAG: MerR family transcriptional regulator [Bacteroidota bacterium]